MVNKVSCLSGWRKSFVLASRCLVAGVVLISLGMTTGCGRKPATLDAPEGTQTYPYPPLDKQP